MISPGPVVCPLGVLGLLVMLLGGCVAPARPPERMPHLETRWLSYLEDGRTTRDEVVSRLGAPSAQFEGERILTYRLALGD
jgi:hypothetical protein